MLSSGSSAKRRPRRPPARHQRASAVADRDRRRTSRSPPAGAPASAAISPGGASSSGRGPVISAPRPRPRPRRTGRCSGVMAGLMPGLPCWRSREPLPGSSGRRVRRGRRSSRSARRRGASETRTERGIVVLSTCVAEVRADLVGDPGRQPGAGVVHREQDRGDASRRGLRCGRPSPPSPRADRAPRERSTPPGWGSASPRLPPARSASASPREGGQSMST